LAKPKAAVLAIAVAVLERVLPAMRVEVTP